MTNPIREPTDGFPGERPKNRRAGAHAETFDSGAPLYFRIFGPRIGHAPRAYRAAHRHR